MAPGYLKVTWDPTIGDPVDVLTKPDGGLMTDETGKPMRGDGKVADAFAQATGAEVKSKRISPGDVKVEAPSPFGVFVDPLCDIFEDAEWLIEESIRSVDYCKRHCEGRSETRRDREPRPGRDAVDGRARERRHDVQGRQDPAVLGEAV